MAAPLGPVILRRRLARGKEDPARLPERQGIASHARPDGPLVWLHGASVGEAVSALGIIDRLLAGNERLNVLLTTGTLTSARLMETRLPDRAIHQFVPLDFPQYTERFINHWRPDAAIWIESEIWPNLIRTTAHSHCRMALLNARMSDRSHRRWQKVPGAIRGLLNSFDLILAQTPEFGARLANLTGREISCIGNLKHCADPLPVDADNLASLQQAIGTRPCFNAASLHQNEDEMVLNAHRLAAKSQPDLLTILVPRHPERGEEVATLAQRAGLVVRRRADGELPDADTEIYIADTLGELGLWFRLAPISLIGGSLVPGIGGHNMLEPARLNSAVLSGPYTDNFRDVVSLMESAGGITIVERPEQIAKTVTELMVDDHRRNTMTTAAKEMTARQDRVLDDLLKELQFMLPVQNR